MTLQDFVAKYLGKQVEYHSYSGALYQCTDLANAYIKEVLGLTPIIGTNAQDFPSRFVAGEFTFIPNTPTGVPQEGDLVIFKSVDKVGHISIFVEGDANSFKSFDQNYPTGSPSKIVTHNYTNVIGWLRPRKEEMPYSEEEMTKVRLERDKNWNYYQAEIQEHKKTAVKLDEVKQELSTVKKTLKEQRDIVASLSEQIGVMEKQVAAHKGEVTKKETEIAVLQARLEDMESGKEIDWSRFTSRKFIGALLAVLLPILNQQFGWELQAVDMLVILSPLLAFIGVEGYTDYVERTA